VDNILPARSSFFTELIELRRNCDSRPSRHRDTRCVVITTSFYSNAARALAASANCMLIEGEQIRDLILGRIVI